jgi:hypothetical protein
MGKITACAENYVEEQSVLKHGWKKCLLKGEEQRGSKHEQETACSLLWVEEQRALKHGVRTPCSQT